MTQDQKRAAILMIIDAIIDTIREAGPLGAPGGVMYAALMAHGITLAQFEQLMGAIVRSGKVVKRGQCYHIA